MSQISQRLMKNGDWALDLKNLPDATVRALIDNPWGEVYFTTSRVDRSMQTKAALRGLSVFTGILWSVATTDDGHAISGPSNTAWLGDPTRNRGDVIKVGVQFDATAVDTAVTSLLPDGIVSGGTVNIPSGAANVSTYHRLETPKAAIERIAAITGGEFRVNPDGTFDFGDPFTVGHLEYNETPIGWLILREEENATVSATTRILTGSKGTTVLDVQDYVTGAYLTGQGGGETIVLGEHDNTTVYKDPNGNTLVWRGVFNEPLASVDDADTVAEEYADDNSSLRQAVTLNLKNFIVGGTLNVGDNVAVYAPPLLEDTSNATQFGDRVLYPAIIRLLGITYPVKEGMGAYFRDHSDNIYDLSDHIIYGEGDTAVEVGDFKRSAIDTSTAALVAQSRGVTSSDHDASVPAQVLGVTSSDDPSGVQGTDWDTYFGPQGQLLAWQKISWTAQLYNVDASDIVDGDRYVISWSPLGEAEDDSRERGAVDYGTEEFVIYGLSPGLQYKVWVRLRDIHGNVSTPSTAHTFTASGTAPAVSKPNEPTVQGVGLSALRVSHDLTQDGGVTPLESNLAYLNVYVDTSTPVTVSDANLAGQLPADFGRIESGKSVWISFTDYGDEGNETNMRRGRTYYVAVQPVDNRGNTSTVSDTIASPVAAGDFTAPTEPSTALAIVVLPVNNGNGRVTATWAYASEPNDVDRFVLRWKRSSESDWANSYTVDSDGGGATAYSYTIEGLDPEDTYDFRLRTVDALGNRSTGQTVLSKQITDTTPPGTPPTPVVTAVTGGVRVTVNLGSGSFGTDNPDVRSLRVYGGTATAPTTFIGIIKTDYSELLRGETVYKDFVIPSGQLSGQYFVRLKARDWFGNDSASYSTEDSIGSGAAQIDGDSGDIATVPGSVFTSGTVPATTEHEWEGDMVSSNFDQTPGSEAGWKIWGTSGDAEFNNVVARGSLYSGSPSGRQVVVDGSAAAVRFYDVAHNLFGELEPDASDRGMNVTVTPAPTTYAGYWRLRNGYDDSTAIEVTLGVGGGAYIELGGDSATDQVYIRSAYYTVIEGSHAYTDATDGGVILSLENASTGDILMTWRQSGTVQWIAGLDQSDSDAWKLGYGAGSFSSPAIAIPTSKVVDFPNGITVDVINHSGAGIVTVPFLQSVNTAAVLRATSSGASAQDLYLQADDAGGVLRSRVYIDGDGSTVLYDNGNATRLTISTAGIAVSGYVTADLQVGNGATYDAQLAVNNQTGTTLTIDRETSTAGAYLFEAYSNVGGTGTQVALMEADGDWRNVNGNYLTISDIRTKKDVKVARSYLSDLIEMSERDAWITYESLLQPGHRLLGVNAQKAEKVWPGMVKTSPEWTVLPDGKRIHMKSFKTSVLPVMNSTAIVELASKVKALEDRLAAL